MGGQVVLSSVRGASYVIEARFNLVPLDAITCASPTGEGYLDRVSFASYLYLYHTIHLPSPSIDER